MKLGLRGALGIVLSAALLWWALRDVHFAEVWGVLRQSDPWLFAASSTRVFRSPFSPSISAP